MKRFYLLLFFIFITTNLSAQDWGINFKGFVKSDFFYDTRETVSIREGHFDLYPKGPELSPDGEDLNDNPSFNLLSIQTRLNGLISAPDALGAKVSGRIEGAFFGATNANINTFRLRHAYLKMDWSNTSLLIGQSWHPLFQTKNFPGVIDFNTGAPFQPFSRNPQIRLDQKFGKFQFSLAAASQRDFVSTGPNGASSEYLRNSLIPDMYAGVNLETEDVYAGLGFDYKILKPRTTQLDGEPADETLGSYAATAFLKAKFGKFQFKTQGLYGQNMTNMIMLGGYASTYNEDENKLEYLNYGTLSVWAELIYGEEIQVALFGAFSQNTGLEDNVVAIPGSLSETPYEVFARGSGYNPETGVGSGIENLIRISPRIIFNYGKLRFALELEYTQAAYGAIDFADKNMIIDSENYSNLRTLFAAYLFF